MFHSIFKFFEHPSLATRFRTTGFFHLERVLVAWFLIWFLVGLVVVASNWRTPMGAWADFIFMALAATVILFSLARHYSWGRIGLAAGWTFVFTGVVEAIGASTGFPFGSYDYTGNFGPLIGGLLPLSIPLAWLVVVWPLFLVVRSVLIPAGKLLWIPTVTATLAVWVDFLLEPVATEPVREYWIWTGGGFYYGVPWTNFLGWWVTAWILSFGLQWLMPNGPLLRGRDLRVILTVFWSVLLTFLVAALVHLLWLPLLLGLPLLLLTFGFVWTNRCPGRL